MSITIEKVSEIHTQIPSSIYPALPLAANDIRLITIQAKGNDDNPDSLSCSLHVSSLDDSTPYHALSYTWGPATVQEADDRPATSITCNGNAILITHNLWTALLRIRDNPELASKRFWIDAISINQTDDAERSRQVQLMASIYSSASCVLIWLGEEDDHTAKALRLIHHLTTIDARHLARLTPQSISQSPLSRDRGGGDDDDDDNDDILHDPTSWDAVRTLFRRNYFCRSWIIQEVVLARSATVLCGRQTTSWTHLESVSHFLSTTSWSSHFSSTSLLRDTTPGACHHNVPTILKANKVSRNRLEGNNNYASALAHALVRTRHFRATDPRDKVYALFGLVGLDGGSPVRDRRRLRPLYGDEVTVESVYVAAAVQILEDTDDLFLLYCVEGDKFRDAALPSWVPDWRCDKALGLRVTGYRRFDASGGLPRTLVIRESCRVLEMRALKIDVVRVAAETKHEIYFGAPFPTLMKILMGEDPRVDEGVLDAVWRSLVTNTGGDPPQCPIDERYKGAFVHWITERLDAISKGLKGGEDAQMAAMIAHFRRLSQSMPPAPGMEDYNTAFSHGLHLRLFETSGGFIGLGSECLQMNDSIWIVPGSRVPLIFRKKGPSHHRLVGGAYVHGVMQGEAVKSSNVKTHEWETLFVE
ncbi:hypothetical protein SGCOL_001129 [Colletotrichum sp. CLE4]